MIAASESFLIAKQSDLYYRMIFDNSIFTPRLHGPSLSTVGRRVGRVGAGEAYFNDKSQKASFSRKASYPLSQEVSIAAKGSVDALGAKIVIAFRGRKT